MPYVAASMCAAQAHGKIISFSLYPALESRELFVILVSARSSAVLCLVLSAHSGSFEAASYSFFSQLS